MSTIVIVDVPTENRRVRRLASYLAGTYPESRLSKDDLHMLGRYQTCYKSFSKKNGEISIFDTANKLQEKLNGELKICQCINIVHNALALFGQLEYPGLSASKVHSIRNWTALYKLNTKKAEKASGNEQEKAAAEYSKLALGALHKITMIKGDYQQKEAGIDYTKWELPTFLEVTDPRALAMKNALINAEELPIIE